MKLVIDTELKTISTHQDIELGNLIKGLKALRPKDWKEFKVIQTVEYNNDPYYSPNYIPNYVYGTAILNCGSTLTGTLTGTLDDSTTTTTTRTTGITELTIYPN